MRVLAAAKVHDVEPPHPVVEAPPAGARGDDRAAVGGDEDVGAVGQIDLPGRDRTAEFERRTGGIGATDCLDARARREARAATSAAASAALSGGRSRPVAGSASRVGPSFTSITHRGPAARCSRLTLASGRPATTDGKTAGAPSTTGAAGPSRSVPRTSSIGFHTMMRPDNAQNRNGTPTSQPSQTCQRRRVERRGHRQGHSLNGALAFTSIIRSCPATFTLHRSGSSTPSTAGTSVAKSIVFPRAERRRCYAQAHRGLG